MSVHAVIKYKKSVWGVIKGFIEKNTWLGLEEFYESLSKALMTEYCLPPAKAKSRRTRKASSLPAQMATNLQQVLPTKNQNERHHVATENTMHSKEIKDRGTTRFETESSSRGIRQEMMSWIVIMLLIALIAFNVILYVKLWRIDEHQHEDVFLQSRTDFLRWEDLNRCGKTKF